MNRRRSPRRRFPFSRGELRPPRADFPAAAVGIASQKQLRDWISGPVSMGADQPRVLATASAAAFSAGLAFGLLRPSGWCRAARCPSPARGDLPTPGLSLRPLRHHPQPLVTAFSPAVISAAHHGRQYWSQVSDIQFHGLSNHIGLAGCLMFRTGVKELALYKGFHRHCRCIDGDPSSTETPRLISF